MSAGEASRQVRQERLLYFLSPIGLIVLWQLAIQAGLGDRRFVPAPSDIAERFYLLCVSGELPWDTVVTLWRIIAGFVLGSIPGVALGLAMAMWRSVRIVIDPLIAALFPIPKLALMPLILLAFGFGETSKIVVVAIGAFFPVIVVVFLIRSFWVEPFKIPSGSMKPTLLVGDFILVNKYTYGIRLPVLNKKIMDVNPLHRGDVVVFRYPDDPNVDYIKRVVGLPGDKVVYRNKRLVINGQAIDWQPDGFYTDSELNYLRLPTFLEKLGNHQHEMMVVPAQPPVDLAQVRQFPHRDNCEYNDDGFACTVPPGEYFMMGDNRDQSSDSRYWGFVPDENIKGRAFLVWMNFGDLRRIGTRIE